MSNDLISRKALLDKLGRIWGIPDDWDGGIDETCETALDVIENTPTAYDIDEVVERLEEKMSDTNFEKATQECNESYLTGLVNGYGEAIEIVKGGWK